MDGEEMTVVVEQDNPTQQNKTHDEKQYSIYNYFREHTTFLVACISALVAVISFALNYAADLHTSSYLQYWMVDTVYANENNTEQVYAVLLALLYSVTIVIAHTVMSKTANVFGVYNRILSVLKWYYQDTKKEFRAFRKKTRKLLRKIKIMKKKREMIESDPLYKTVEQLRQEEEACESVLGEIRSMKRTCELWLSLNIIGSAMVVFGLVVVATSLMTVGTREYSIWGPLAAAGLVVTLDFLLYFVPAYRSTRVKKSKYKDISLEQVEEEIQHANNHKFPLAVLLRTSAKSLLSNKRIKQIAVLTLSLLVILVGVYTSSGKNDAEKKKEFPIFIDETGTYAVVYNNGDSLVLKAAYIEDNQIEIDVRQQKVISAKDVSYEIYTFETIIVTGKDGG